MELLNISATTLTSVSRNSIGASIEGLSMKEANSGLLLRNSVMLLATSYV